MIAALIVLVAVLVLAVGISLMGAGPSRVRRRVVYVSSPSVTRTRVRRPDGPIRRRRTVIDEGVSEAAHADGAPGGTGEPEAEVETRRIVEYE